MGTYGIHSADGYLVTKNGTPLANFAICEILVYHETEDDRTPAMLRLGVRHLGQQYTADLNLRDPHLLRQLQTCIPTCKLLKPGARELIEAYILEFQAQAKTGPPPLYFRQHGFHRLTDGRLVFVAGDEVLGLPEGREYAVAPSVARAHLAYDGSLSQTEALKGFWKVLERDGDVVLPIWGFTLISMMRSLLTNMNITTYPSGAVVGKQGSGKTTVCQRFSLLYNDSKHANRYWAQRDARSSAASVIEDISRYRDQVVLVDDQAKSASQREAQLRKDLIAEVLRFASNDTERSKLDLTQQVNERFCTAGVLCTSEFSFDNPSDIGRIAILQIDREMQDGKPQDRIFAATVFRYFLLWFIPRLDATLSDLEEHLESVSGNHQRLQKNWAMILWALQQFLRFVEESGAVKHKHVVAMLNYSAQVCNAIMARQIEQIEQLEHQKNISWYILEGIQNKGIKRISKKQLESSAKTKDLPRFYYVRKKRPETIYITTNVLYRYLMEKTPLRFSSVNAMDKELIQEGLILPGQEKRAAKIRINDCRYLGLLRTDLAEAACSADP